MPNPDLDRVLGQLAPVPAIDVALAALDRMDESLVELREAMKRIPIPNPYHPPTRSAADALAMTLDVTEHNLRMLRTYLGPRDSGQPR